MNECAFRLKEERARLGMTQDAFAEVAGVSKRAVANYESGDRKPDSDFLAAIAAAGADVLYILTGQRSFTPPAVGLRAVPSSYPPPSDEQALLADYRACDAAGRAIIRAASQAAAKAASTPASAPRRRRAG